MQTENHSCAVVVERLLARGCKNGYEGRKAVNKVDNHVEGLLDDRVQPQVLCRRLNRALDQFKQAIGLLAARKCGQGAAVLGDGPALGAQEETRFEAAHKVGVVVENFVNLLRLGLCFAESEGQQQDGKSEQFGEHACVLSEFK